MTSQSHSATRSKGLTGTPGPATADYSLPVGYPNYTPYPPHQLTPPPPQHISPYGYPNYMQPVPPNHPSTVAAAGSSHSRASTAPHGVARPAFGTPPIHSQPAHTSAYYPPPPPVPPPHAADPRWAAPRPTTGLQPTAPTAAAPSAAAAATAATAAPSSASQDAARRALFSYLSSPACFLFSRVVGAVALTELDLDSVLAAAKNDPAWTVHHLKYLDLQGEKFFNFQTLAQRVRVLEHKKEREVEKLRNMLAQPNSPLYVKAAATQHAAASAAQPSPAALTPALFTSAVDVEHFVLDSNVFVFYLARLLDKLISEGAAFDTVFSLSLIHI